MNLKNTLYNTLKLGTGFLLLYELNGCGSTQEVVQKKEAKVSHELKGKDLGKGKKDKTTLIPLKWKNHNTKKIKDTNYFASFPELNDSSNVELKAIVNKKDTIGAYLVQIQSSKFLKLLGTWGFENGAKLVKEKIIPSEVKDSIFYNGLYGTKEEFAKLKNGAYFAMYVAANKRASLPVIFFVNNKDTAKNLEKYLESKDSTYKTDSTLAKKDSLYSQDTTKTTAKGTTKIKKRRETLEEKLTIKEELERSIDVGFGYDFKDVGLYVLSGRYNIGKLILGAELGFGENSVKKPDVVVLTPRDPITGFIGNGVSRENEKNINTYFGLETGYDLGNVSLTAGIGLEKNRLTKTNEVEEYLRNNTNQVVSHNKNSYADSKDKNYARFNPGIDVNLGNVKLNARANISKEKPSFGAKIYYNLK